MPDPRRAKRGHLAEELIERSCLYYRSKGLALITKNQTPVTVLSGGRAFFRAKATSDFSGLLRGSIPVALEVKSSRNLTRFRLDEERQGALPRCSLAPLDRVERWLAEEGVASIPFTNLDAETWDCPFSGVLQAFDFLPGLRFLAQNPRQTRAMSTALPLVGSRHG